MAQSALGPEDPSSIGRYRLVARLGEGGMGVVYLGMSEQHGQVAIKVPRRAFAGNQDFRARFRREVLALGRVQGVCTVRVIESDTESARPFLVTEYASGPSLSEHVEASGPLDAGRLRGLATGLAEALAAIHRADVVHRDLKPSNVLLTATGPKVIDFGIAQTLDLSRLTRTGGAVGTPSYMAPEQFTGSSGPATDIYAWGLTVVFAASGQPPFGSGPVEVLPYRILHETPDISSVPEPLRPVVAAALAKDPAERPTALNLLWYLGLRTDQPVQTTTRVLLSRTWWMPPPTQAYTSRACSRSTSCGYRTACGRGPGSACLCVRSHGCADASRYACCGCGHARSCSRAYCYGHATSAPGLASACSPGCACDRTGGPAPACHPAYGIPRVRPAPLAANGAADRLRRGCRPHDRCRRRADSQLRAWPPSGQQRNARHQHPVARSLAIAVCCPHPVGHARFPGPVANFHAPAFSERDAGGHTRPGRAR